MTDEQKRAYDLLCSVNAFYPDDGDGPCLNLNDTFYWACSDCEDVPLSELPELWRLFKDYGWCGVYYWVLERRSVDAVEFHDVNRMVQFVRQEESIRKAIPSSSKRAYHRASYTISNPEELPCRLTGPATC